MSEWSYIIGAYALTYIVLAAYALRLRALRSRAAAPQHAGRGDGQ